MIQYCRQGEINTAAVSIAGAALTAHLKDLRSQINLILGLFWGGPIESRSVGEPLSGEERNENLAIKKIARTRSRTKNLLQLQLNSFQTALHHCCCCRTCILLLPVVSSLILVYRMIPLRYLNDKH
eukprot:scaffold29737_cov73-Skeletonema_marinoi.AAC.1